ncbi:hypothetical protein HAX54_038500, partial [Datura stramonium]|nr:hypothetical protein [Datura stramonium]
KGNRGCWQGFQASLRGTKRSSSSAKGAPTRRFGERAVEPHGLSWFNIQKEVKYALENWIYYGLLALEFPTIRDKVRQLGLGYIFLEPEECNLTLVREIYANCDTSFGERNEVIIQVPVDRFTTKTFNAFLGTPVVDPSEYLILLEKPPYQDIHHTLCGDHSFARWERDHSCTH